MPPECWVSRHAPPPPPAWCLFQSCPGLCECLTRCSRGYYRSDVTTHTTKPQRGNVEARSTVLDHSGPYEDLSPPKNKDKLSLEKVSCLSVPQFPFIYLWVFRQGHTVSPCPCNCPHASTNTYTPGWSLLQLKKSWLCKAAAVPPGTRQTRATHK